MKLCPGRLDIQIDVHKLFNETAKQVIERKPSEYGEYAPGMIARDCIIRVEAAPFGKKMPPALCYHWDLEFALKNCLNQIERWEPK